MSKTRLIQSIRCCGGPAFFLTGTCLTIGIAFLALDSGAGWIFVVAAGSTLLAFALLGAGGDSAPDLRLRRLPLRAKGD